MRLTLLEAHRLEVGRSLAALKAAHAELNQLEADVSKLCSLLKTLNDEIAAAEGSTLFDDLPSVRSLSEKHVQARLLDRQIRDFEPRRESALSAIGSAEEILSASLLAGLRAVLDGEINRTREGLALFFLDAGTCNRLADRADNVALLGQYVDALQRGTVRQHGPLAEKVLLGLLE